MKNLCIIQARTGSTRLPNKVLKKVNGISLLEYEILRIKQAKRVSKIVIATTEIAKDDKIESMCEAIGIDCFRGSEEDVLDRYYQCSLGYPKYKNIIRITGDCPLIDPWVIDAVVLLFENNNFDYASNTEKETYPDGMDVEVFKSSVLKKAVTSSKLSSEREHVTQYIRKNKKFKKGNLLAEHDWSNFRFTVDETEDLEVIRFLVKNSKINDNYLHYISVLKNNPKYMLKNIHIERNQGLLKSLKQDIKKHGKKIYKK